MKPEFWVCSPRNQSRFSMSLTLVFAKIIAEGAVFKKKRGQNREKIIEAERDKPKTQVVNEF